LPWQLPSPHFPDAHVTLANSLWAMGPIVPKIYFCPANISWEVGAVPDLTFPLIMLE
jgi:hypothetical protein